MPGFYFAFDEVFRDYGFKFVRAAREAQELFYQANGLFTALQDGSWNGDKTKRFINGWDALTPQIEKVIFTLLDAGTLMKAASESFEALDR